MKLNQAQADANRRNAQLSTGPRTEEGKARSSQNSRTHGLTAKDLVIQPQDLEEFESLQGALKTELVPVGELESEHFDHVLQATWNLRRCRRLETSLAAGGVDPLVNESQAKVVDRIQRYQRQTERSYHRSLAELKALQNERAVREMLLAEIEPDAAKSSGPGVQNEAGNSPLVSIAAIRRTWLADRDRRIAVSTRDLERQMKEFKADRQHQEPEA